MPRIVCPCYECVHHSITGETCTAGKIVLGWHGVHTRYQGFKEFWTCHQYEMSEKYTDIVKQLRNVLTDEGEI